MAIVFRCVTKITMNPEQAIIEAQHIIIFKNVWYIRRAWGVLTAGHVCLCVSVRIRFA